MKFSIFMSICTWSERWLVVHRAQAHDNPVVSRSDNVVYVYSAMHTPRHYIQCRNAGVVIKRQEAGGAVVRFNLVSRSHARDHNDSRVVSEIECKAPIYVFEWLRDVLADDFGQGRGPRIDPATGRAAIPVWAQRMANGQRVQRPQTAHEIVADRQRRAAVSAPAGVGAEVVPVPVPPRSSSLSAHQNPHPSSQVTQDEQLSPEVQAFDEMLASRGQAEALAQFGPAVAQQHAEAQRRAYEAAFATAQARQSRASTGGMAAGSGLVPHATTSVASVAPAPAPPQAAAGWGGMYPPMASMITAQPTSSSHTVPSSTSVPVPEAPVAPVTMDERGVPVDAEDPPSHLCCVLTMDLFEDPVFLSDGHTYERSAIEQWLKDHNTSPKTNLPLPDGRLVPNHALRGQVIEWIEEQQRVAKQAAKDQAAAEQAAAERAAAERAAAEAEEAQRKQSQTAPASSPAPDADPVMSYLRLAEEVPPQKDVFTFHGSSEEEQAEATAPPAPVMPVGAAEEQDAPAAAAGADSGAVEAVAPESGLSEATAALSSGVELGGTYVHFDDDDDLEQTDEVAISEPTSDFNPFLEMPDAPSHHVGGSKSTGSVSQPKATMALLL